MVTASSVPSPFLYHPSFHQCKLSSIGNSKFGDLSPKVVVVCDRQCPPPFFHFVFISNHPPPRSILLGSRGYDIPKISHKLDTLKTAHPSAPPDPIADTDIKVASTP